MKKQLIIFFLFFLLLSFILIKPSFSQEDTVKMSISDCINTALKNNYNLLDEKQKIDILYRKLEQENKGRLPAFYLRQTGNLNIRGDADNTANSELAFRFTQPLYDAGKIGFNQEEAFLNLEKEILKYELARNTVIYTAFTYYYNLIRDEKLLEISRSDLEQSEKLLEIARARFNAGDIAEIEVLKAQVQVAQSEDTIISSQASRDASMDRLLRYLEMTFGVVVTPTEEVKYSPFIYDLEQSIQLAVDNRADLKSSKDDILLGHVALGRVKNTILPVIDLTGSVRYKTETTTDAKTPYQVLVTSTWELPIYDRGKRKDDIRDAEINLELKKIKYEQLEKDIILEVRNAFRDMKTLENRIELRKKILAQAEENLKATQLQYQMGFVTILEVTVTSQSLTAARRSYIQSIMDFELAKERLALVMGIIGKDWPETVQEGEGVNE